MANLDESLARVDAVTAKYEELEPYLESGSFWPKAPVQRRLASFLAFNGLGAGLLAAHKLGDFHPSLVFFSAGAHVVAAVFFVASLVESRKLRRKLRELQAVIEAE